MKEKAFIICCYALLLLIGGIIGYVAVNSLISLVTSTLFALILFCCAALVWKESQMAYHLATLIITCLFAFFSYRFFLSYKIAPAGVMALISGILTLYLIIQRKKISSKISLHKN